MSLLSAEWYGSSAVYSSMHTWLAICNENCLSSSESDGEIFRFYGEKQCWNVSRWFKVKIMLKTCYSLSL